MKDFIALGFIIALIGATSAIANAHGNGHVVAMTSVGQSGIVGLGSAATGSLEQTLYVAQNASEYGYNY
ncbi:MULTISPECIES: hypothetical protein [unclassified Pseudomonas]|uniref:hypothetical protein n=1 Tax=unclassified Pseudomonas TaxID=196821 RepID=UPI000A1DEF0A|nr:MULTISPECIES: hypothetical protein [unclassified Pseudomonas]MDI2143435.1 hypothetical protein [Pseudomonas sp. ITA]